MSKIEALCDHSQTELKEVSLGLLKMGNLKMLYLEGNHIEYLPEDFFQKLDRLSWLDLRNNKLKAIPAGVVFHSYLEYLLLESNKIMTLPNELGLVPNLKVLQVAYNPLQYPSQEIISQGCEKITNFLKAEYQKANALEILPTEETLSIKEEEEDEENALIPSKKEKISVRELLKRSKADKLGMERFPVIAIRSLSTEQQNDERKWKNVVPAPIPTPKFVNKKSCSRQVRKTSRYYSKLPECNLMKEKKTRNFDDEIAKQELKDLWLSKLKELLADQEKLLQRERNLKSFNVWRLNKKLEPVRSVDFCKTASTPYDTDPRYNKILSRKDLALALDDEIRKRKSVPKNVDIQNLISEIMCQLKILDVTKKAKDLTPRSEVLIAERKMQTLIDLHKKVNELQSKNDSYLE